MVQQDIYLDIRRQALGWTVVLIGTGIWISVLAANLVSPRLQTEWIAGAVAAIGLCVVLYRLREQHLRFACYTTVACLWAGNAIIALHSPSLGLYLFGLVILLSSGLIRLPATFLLAILSTTVIIAIDVGQSLVAGPLFNVWGSLIASIVVSRCLYQALESINRHHDYAVEQMNLARDHRAQLVKLTKALQEASDALRHANIQLRYARESADEARRLKAQFAANVSHELRTPINLVIGYSEVMVTAPEIYGAPLPPAYRGDIQAIYRNAKHLQDLINDILDISQIEASRLAISKEKTDLRQTITESAKMAGDLIAAKDLRFSLELPDHLPEVWIDRVRIRQVLLNLLANAVRFTDRGAITLSVREAHGEIIVSVKDTGIGISKEDLERVFEEFYQADNSLPAKQMGTGLGLTLSMHVVQHHGGRLWAESDGIPGCGSTFSFSLPLSAEEKLMLGKSLAGATADHAPKCVIVFNDDVAVSQLFKRYLNNHDVVISRSQDEVLRLAQMIQPSAIVLDRSWRDTDLGTCLSRSSADTATIFCPMPGGRRALQSYGAADYLVKPVTREALINAILALDKPVHTIVIIDDERDVTRMLSRMIAAFDPRCIVLQAHNGQDGLEMMRRQHPDLVLLDIQMPVMDGLSIIQHMKADPALRDIPVIIASAQSAEETISTSIEGEIAMIRPSGFSPVELVNSVEALVSVLVPSTVAAPPGN